MSGYFMAVKSAISKAIDTLKTSFAESNGAQMMGFIQSGTGAIKRTVQDKMREVISVKDFGAVGDFNPSTGVGTDDRAAIQAALNYSKTVLGGCRVVFPSGSYYLGAGNSVTGYQLMLGSLTNQNDATNVVVSGYGASLYGGNDYGMFGVYNTNNCTIEGLKLVCFAGGSYDTSREYSHALDTRFNTHITIQNNYITNFLGDGIYVNGPSQHVKILNNTIKKRYGNGVLSSAGGTASRECVAVVNAYDVLIEGNQFIGTIDFENNLASEYLTSCSMIGNIFSSGHVTPQTVVGTDYWHDEPIAVTGGTTIKQGIQFSGPGFSTAEKKIPLLVVGNRFEYGTIFFNSNNYKVDLRENHFDAGEIRVGDTSGTNDNSFYRIENNTVDAPIGANTYAILLGGDVYSSYFANNVCKIDNGYLISTSVGNGDKGRNVFVNNANMSNDAAGVFSITQNDSSVYANNWWRISAQSVQSAKTKAQEVKKQSTGSWPLISVTSASQAVAYSTIGSDTFMLSCTGSGTLGSITGAPDGAELTIEFDGAGMRIVNSISIRLKSGIDAVSSSSNDMITLICRSGIFWEKCRNF